jgi:hypothetical protein
MKSRLSSSSSSAIGFVNEPIEDRDAREEEEQEEG